MHKILSYKALRDYFKTEKQILKEKTKESVRQNSTSPIDNMQDLRYVMANILKPFAKGIFYSKVFDKNP